MVTGAAVAGTVTGCGHGGDRHLVGCCTWTGCPACAPTHHCQPGAGMPEAASAPHEAWAFMETAAHWSPLHLEETVDG
jgi:hypothetical protein